MIEEKVVVSAYSVIEGGSVVGKEENPPVDCFLQRMLEPLSLHH